MAQALFDPKGDRGKTDNQIRATVILTALKMLTQYDGICVFLYRNFFTHNPK